MSYVVNEMPPQVASEKIARYATVETATVGHRRLMGFMDPAIQCVLSPRRVAGTAVTLALPGADITLFHYIVSHLRPGAMSETEYVGQVLGKVKRFAQAHGVHVWFIAHPSKMHKDGGKMPVPSLYDIAGSANWANKADIGLVVHRDPNKKPPEAEIHIRKVRFKAVGQIGMVTLKYDRATGQYREVAAW